MSHPYWPQSQYLFRPGGRQSQAPVPHSLGQDDYAGARYETVGTPAPRSLRRGNRTYGSMTPRHDWATPGYIREEPSGMGYFGEDAMSCAGSLKDAVVSYLCGKLKANAAQDDMSQMAIGAACGLIGGLLNALDGIAGDLNDDAVKQRIHDAVFSALPDISLIPALDSLDVKSIIVGALDGLVNVLLQKCPLLVDKLRGAGETQLQKWCAAGYAFDSSGNAYPPEAPNQAHLAANCASWGYPYNGPSQFVPAEANILMLPSAQKTVDYAATQRLAEQRFKSGLMTVSQGKEVFAANCANMGGVVVPGTDPFTGQPTNFCQPGEELKAQCRATGGTPTWDPINKYKCQPGGAGVPGAAAGGAGGIAVIAGVAALALLLFKR